MKLKSLGNRNRKGQAAVEYLTTYGWAILVTLVVGVALWQMGAFKPPSTPPGCTGFSQVTPIDHVADGSADRMGLTLTNEAGVKVKLNRIDVDIFGKTCSNSGINKELRAGQSYQVNVTSCTLPDTGNYYRAKITITYTNLVSGIKHKSVGECHGSVE